jgi:hypothetical protein
MDGMAHGVGLSVGATNLAAVVLGRVALTRSPVVTIFAHRPLEVGVPSENPGLNPRLNPNHSERGLIITGFVDRVGDPVGVVAADGSTHRGEVVLSDALRVMVSAVTRGQARTDPVAVTHPAHWRPLVVDSLRGALSTLPEFSRGPQPVVVSDAVAVLTALQDDPGLPTRGLIALCDFGGSGTSLTLADVANGFQPVGPTVRHPDFSGDLIDQAVLARVIGGLSAAGSVNLSSTSAIHSLTRLRGQCRGAKERLSTSAVTVLSVELPGFCGDVRLTRTELDDAIRQPLANFVDAVENALQRSGIRPADLVAIASTGGGAAIPAVTTTLSQHLRVPVITSAQPGLTAAVGGGMWAVRGWIDASLTSVARPAPVAPATPQPGDLAASHRFPAPVWPPGTDVPDGVPTHRYDYDSGETPPDQDGSTGAGPQPLFGDDGWAEDAFEPAPPWYRRPVGMVAIAIGVVAFVLFGAAGLGVLLRHDSNSAPAATTSAVPTTSAMPTTTAVEPPPAADDSVPPSTQPPSTPSPQSTTVTQAPPITQAPPPPGTDAPPPGTDAPPPGTDAPPPGTDAPPPANQAALSEPIPHIPRVAGRPPF